MRRCCSFALLMNTRGNISPDYLACEATHRDVKLRLRGLFEERENRMPNRVMRKIALIVGLSFLLSIPNVSQAQQKAAARIKVDIDRQIGGVNPHLLRNFSEHLGRMIYGGIYEEGSPLSDPDGYRKDVMEAAKNLNDSILRWPVGNFASGSAWKDGIEPKDQRPLRTDA